MLVLGRIKKLLRKLRMKKIIVDVRHPAHLNFFRPVLYKLKEKGWEIDIVVIDRGRVLKITQKEFPEFCVTKIGVHRGTKLSIILEANILRFFQMILFLRHKKYNIGISVSSFILGAAAKLQGVPNLQFYDDPEYKKHVRLQKLTSTKTYYPKIKEFGSHIETFNALKEWAYLSPKYFSPNAQVLEEFDLVGKKYIFVREVINSSLNYSDQASNLVATISTKFPAGYTVLLSLEDKKTKDLYPKHWIILQEPLNDIHSLMYYSSFMVASGDSMAREAALLGVPSVYCGIREMTANKKLIDLNMLFQVNVETVPDFLDKLISKEILIEDKNRFREKLLKEWVDVSEFIEEKILEYAR